MSTHGVAAVCSLVLLTCCSPSPSEQRGIKHGDTQVVAQWLEDGSGWSRLIWTFTAEDRVTEACSKTCFVDGNDLGSGTRNLYIYTAPKDVQNTVKILIGLEHDKRLPPNMRIGFAVYRNKNRSDWTYQAVYPPGLRHFDISYSGANQIR